MTASDRRRLRRVDLVSEHASPLAVLGGTDAGGQNVAVAELARHLSLRGLRVVVHTRRDSPSLPDCVEMSPGVTVHHVNAGPPSEVPKDEMFPFMDAFARELATAWNDDRPDIVHTHFWMSGYAGTRAAWALGVPIVHTFHALGVVKRRHQAEADTSPPARLQAEVDLLHHADHIVATCTDERRELLALGADPARISVVPCGVDLDHFTPAEPRAGGRLRVLSLGRLVPRKGVDDVIRAIALVDDAELVVAGGPAADAMDLDPEVCRLRALARGLGVGDRVTFAGRVDRDHVPAVIRACDVAVCVPWYEPFGIVPVEVMACGRPIVVSSVGGLTDTVVDGRTGLVVRPRDVAGLASALRRLQADPALRARLGHAGAERARSSYSWEVVADATAAVYRLVLGSRVQRSEVPS
jgi:type III pantothenate kinase